MPPIHTCLILLLPLVAAALYTPPPLYSAPSIYDAPTTPSPSEDDLEGTSEAYGSMEGQDATERAEDESTATEDLSYVPPATPSKQKPQPSPLASPKGKSSYLPPDTPEPQETLQRPKTNPFELPKREEQSPTDHLQQTHNSIDQPSHFAPQPLIHYPPPSSPPQQPYQPQQNPQQGYYEEPKQFQQSPSPQQDGYNYQEPQEGYTQQRPQEGYTQQRPQEGYTQQRPQEGYTQQRPEIQARHPQEVEYHEEPHFQPAQQRQPPFQQQNIPQSHNSFPNQPHFQQPPPQQLYERPSEVERPQFQEPTHQEPQFQGRREEGEVSRGQFRGESVGGYTRGPQHNQPEVEQRNQRPQSEEGYSSAPQEGYSGGHQPVRWSDQEALRSEGRPTERQQRIKGLSEELEGLNGKIVDERLLERVQQIIEEHERRQQKAFSFQAPTPESHFTPAYPPPQLPPPQLPPQQVQSSPDFQKALLSTYFTQTEPQAPQHSPPQQPSPAAPFFNAYSTPPTQFRAVQSSYEASTTPTQYPSVGGYVEEGPRPVYGVPLGPVIGLEESERGLNDLGYSFPSESRGHVVFRRRVGIVTRA